MTRKEFVLYILLASLCLIKEIWIEKQKETMEIRGAAGIMTDICRTQVYVAIAIQSGGFNGSLNF